MLEKLNPIEFLERVRYALASANATLEERIYALEANSPSSFSALFRLLIHPTDQTEKD